MKCEETCNPFCKTNCIHCFVDALITIYQTSAGALKTIPINAAYQYQEEDIYGCLQEGKLDYFE